MQEPVERTRFLRKTLSLLHRNAGSFPSSVSSSSNLEVRAMQAVFSFICFFLHSCLLFPLLLPQHAPQASGPEFLLRHTQIHNKFCVEYIFNIQSTWGMRKVQHKSAVKQKGERTRQQKRQPIFMFMLIRESRCGVVLPSFLGRFFLFVCLFMQCTLVRTLPVVKLGWNLC